MLDLSAQETEETLCRLVVSKTVWARIDRPAGIINFRQQQTAEDVHYAQHRVPGCIAIRLFGALVPHLDNRDEGRHYGALVQSQIDGI